MPEIHWKAPAVEDLLAIVDDISDDDPSAALELMDDIHAKVACRRIIRNAAVGVGLKAKGN